MSGRTTKSFPSSDLTRTIYEEALELHYQAESKKMEEWLSLKYGGPVRDFLPSVLFQPLKDILGRSGKRVRGRLVEIGYQLAFPARLSLGRHSDVVSTLSEVIEYLHSGSLVVDDVQDGSKMRRNEPTLHLKYGMPLALNTGNWLYFWPLEVVRQLNLKPENELQIYRIYNRTMVRAHVGQALDVGLPIHRIPQEKVPGVCLSAMELKSGALFALALVLGASAGGADEKLVHELDVFGHGFGMALQMYDDLGNIKGRVEPTKRWEDLMLRRPTSIWACAASHYSKASYDQFISAVLQLPQDRRLLRWFEHHRFSETMSKEIRAHLDRCTHRLETAFKDKPCYQPLLKRLRDLGDEISKSYG